MTEKLSLPKQVIDSDWKDDIDYEPFGTNKQEMEYISPTEVSKESLRRIKARRRGATFLSVFNSNVAA